MSQIKKCSHTTKSSSICPEIKNTEQKAPLRYWEIDNYFKCPVVGMCLTLSEQKRLLKKAGLSVKDKSPFEIHETLVGSSDGENRLSRKVDNLLNRKFGKEVAPLLALDHEQFRAHFKASLKTGDCIGVSWAAAINPGLPVKVKREIFGDIHMIMHWSGERGIKLKQRLTRQRKEVGELHQRVKEVTQQRRVLQKENAYLKKTHAKMQSSLAVIERENNELKAASPQLDSHINLSRIEQENQILKEELAISHSRNEDKQRQIDLLRQESLRLSSELVQLQNLNTRIRKEAQEIIGEAFALNSCDTACPSFDLCKKRILIVGGLTRMESLYRQLIESSGGIFEYHDGYMKKGVKSLESRLRRADMVLCPVSCNSHGACSAVKNLAKKHNKTVHMLSNSSLSAVSQVIWGTIERGTIN